jgi:transcriptional regulator with XRE-family HTH domain
LEGKLPAVKEVIKIDGAKLRHHRLDNFLEQRELAERAGVTPQTIREIERGAWPSGSRPSTFRKLAAALNIDPHELLAD